MSIWGLGDAIRSRIIVELLSPGEYSEIWLFALANTGIWIFAWANTGIWISARGNILESAYTPGIEKMMFSVKT